MILQPVTTGGGSQRVRRIPDGTKDGANKVFTTPGGEKFLMTSGYEVWFFVNGVLKEAGGSSDYVASESGGPGTGFDTITLNDIAPDSWDNLTMVYFITG